MLSSGVGRGNGSRPHAGERRQGIKLERSLKKIYVGNLSRNTSEQELEAAFSTHGAIRSVAIIRDRYTGDSRGFGFVEMDNEQEAGTAIAALNGTELGGRTLTVNEAKPMERRSGGGGGGGGYGGGGGGGGRGGGGGGRDRGGYGGGGGRDRR